MIKTTLTYQNQQAEDVFLEEELPAVQGFVEGMKAGASFVAAWSDQKMNGLKLINTSNIAEAHVDISRDRVSVLEKKFIKQREEEAKAARAKAQHDKEAANRPTLAMPHGSA